MNMPREVVELQEQQNQIINAGLEILSFGRTTKPHALRGGGYSTSTRAWQLDCKCGFTTGEVKGYIAARDLMETHWRAEERK
jgi:hypothetical protein